MGRVEILCVCERFGDVYILGYPTTIIFNRWVLIPYAYAAPGARPCIAFFFLIATAALYLALISAELPRN